MTDEKKEPWGDWETEQRFYAAAPDMLEALQAIYVMWQYGEGFTDECEAQVSAAIAKATGEQP